MFYLKAFCLAWVMAVGGMAGYITISLLFDLYVFRVLT